MSNPTNPTNTDAELDKILTVFGGAAIIGNTRHNDVAVEFEKAKAAIQAYTAREVAKARTDGIGSVIKSLISWWLTR
jgi:hypothetical protein